jgi:drug/metabolite transporter (DMT)-like permease
MNKSFLQRIGIYPLISLAVIFWGMSYVWTTIVFKYYHPISTIFIRLVISSALLVAYTWFSGKAEKIKRGDRWLLLISALFNPFLYFLFENYGLKNSTPTISAVIIATIPVFVSIVGYFMLKENLSLINIIGIIVSFLGIGIMLVNPDFSLNSSWAGILFLSGAVIMAVIYTVLLKRLAHKYSALTILTYQNIIGVVYFLPLFLFFDYKYFITVRPNFELVYSLLSLAVFASTLAFIFYIMAVRQIGVSRTSVFSNLMPVVTAIFSAIFISEIFTATKITGMAIVIVGVMVAQVKKRGSREAEKQGI